MKQLSTVGIQRGLIVKLWARAILEGYKANVRPSHGVFGLGVETTNSPLYSCSHALDPQPGLAVYPTVVAFFALTVAPGPSFNAGIAMDNLNVPPADEAGIARNPLG